MGVWWNPAGLIKLLATMGGAEPSLIAGQPSARPGRRRKERGDRSRYDGAAIRAATARRGINPKGFARRQAALAEMRRLGWRP